MKHIFSSTNRHAQAIYWVPDKTGRLVTCATRTLLVHHIDHTGQLTCRHARNEHSATVSAMNGDGQTLVTGDAKGNMIVWDCSNDELLLKHRFDAHHADPVNYVSVTRKGDSVFILTSAGDGKLKLVVVTGETTRVIEHTALPLYPLCCAITSLPNQAELIIAAAYDDYSLRFYLVNDESTTLVERAKLIVGEDWTTNLSFAKNGDGLRLAIGNHDHLCRVLQIELNRDGDKNEREEKYRLEVDKKMLSESKWELKMETILNGHANWVTASSWLERNGKFELATASMDKSIIIWSSSQEKEEEAESSSSSWDDYCHLGEVGGGTLGFLGVQSGLDQHGIRGLAVYSYTGSLHIWWNDESDHWRSGPAPSGHYDSVRDLQWASNGAYLLTTSQDKSTRLFGETKNGTWSELARPQVHGHGLRCLALLSDLSFCSGAEEKVIRVFRSPRNFHANFERLTGISLDVAELEGVPEGAAVPALGLSNKAIFDESGTVQADREISHGANELYMSQQFTALKLTEAPKEEDLIQNSLWWEERKLYGHGAELQSLAVSPDQKWIASSCKASKQSQAVVMIWDARRNGQPSCISELSGHQLTVIRIVFSPDSNRLLTLGRDRIAIVWALVEGKWQMEETIGKEKNGHTRLIWNGCWTSDGNGFYTVGRDKLLIKWRKEENEWVRSSAVQFKEAVTAVDAAEDGLIIVGTESGQIIQLNDDNNEIKHVHVYAEYAHASTVNQIALCPVLLNEQSNKRLIASCGDDHQVKVFCV